MSSFFISSRLRGNVLGVVFERSLFGWLMGVGIFIKVVSCSDGIGRIVDDGVQSDNPHHSTPQN